MYVQTYSTCRHTVIKNESLFQSLHCLACVTSDPEMTTFKFVSRKQHNYHLIIESPKSKTFLHNMPTWSLYEEKHFLHDLQNGQHRPHIVFPKNSSFAWPLAWWQKINWKLYNPSNFTFTYGPSNEWQWWIQTNQIVAMSKLLKTLH
jgi:hypothetical protein